MIDAEPQTIFAQPLELQTIGLTVFIVHLGQPDQKAAFEVKYYVTQGDPVFSFGAAPASHADEAGQLAVGISSRHEYHQSNAFLQSQLAADDELDAGFLRGHMGFDYPCKGTLVRDG